MKTYKLSILPLAQEDILNTIRYIAENLAAPVAAENLLAALESSILRLADFPYSYKVYRPIAELEDEYRMMPVKNYLVFYTVLEEVKTVEIRRVIYARRDIEAILK